MALYGVGDAQIDAQENTTRRIGDILAAYTAQVNAGSINRAFIQSTMNQIQSAINDYAQLWSNTKRGEAGRVTLQNFYETSVRPGLVAAFNAASTDTQQIPVPSNIPNPDLTASPGMVPAPYNPNVNYNITIDPGSAPAAATPGNMQPSDTPAPPPGITIPGTVQTVNASLPTNPIVYVGIGLALLFLFAGKHQNA